MATTFKRPGVYVQEVASPAQVAGVVNSDSVAAFAGAANRGPLTPTLVKTWAQFTTLFGDFTNSTYLANTLFQFFTNGGRQAYVCRIANSSAVVATRTLTDNASTPLSTLVVNAANPGKWGNSIYLDVVSTTTGRFDLVVKFGGVSSGNIVERFPDLSMVQTDQRYVVNVVNTLSNYITVVDQFSATAAPNNTPLAQSGTALASGADGTTYTAGDVSNAVNQFLTIDGTLVFNLAGITDSTQLSNALTVAEQTGRWFVVCDLAAGLTPASAVTAAAALYSTSYGAAYYPWLTVNDPTKQAQVAKSVPPGGTVVGRIVATDAQKGPYQAPAGVQYGRIAGVYAVERAFTDDDLDLLNSSSPAINVIRPVNNYGICVMGARTLVQGTTNRYVSVRRSLNYIKKTVQDLTAPAVFQPNDVFLWRALSDSIRNFLSDYRSRGGLTGASDAAAFFVKCDTDTNTPATIQAGEVHVQVGVAPQFPAEFVVINIGQFQGGSTATES